MGFEVFGEAIEDAFDPGLIGDAAHDNQPDRVPIVARRPGFETGLSAIHPP